MIFVVIHKYVKDKPIQKKTNRYKAPPLKNKPNFEFIAFGFFPKRICVSNKSPLKAVVQNLYVTNQRINVENNTIKILSCLILSSKKFELFCVLSKKL